MSTAQIEKRLVALEKEVAHLKSEAGKRHPIHALESIHNTFDNDEAFKEATRLGRKWRKSQRVSGQKSKAKRK